MGSFQLFCLDFFFFAFGFLAFRLLGFLAFWLLGFWAFRLFGFLLVYAAFGGFFGFGFSHPLLSQFPSGLLAFAPFHFWIWLPASSASPVPYLNHHFLEHHGGGSTPPPPTRYCLDCLQSNCTPIHTSSNIMGGAATPPLLFRLFAEIELHPCSNHHFCEHHGGGTSLLFSFLFFTGPASYFFDFVTHGLLVMLGMLVGHAGDVENNAGDVDGLV